MKDESALVKQATLGDQGAFGELVERHWARLVRLARSVVGESEAVRSWEDSMATRLHTSCI